MNPLFSKFTAGGFQVGIYIHYLRGTQYFRPVAMGVDFKTLSLGYSSNQIEKAMETLRRRGIVVGNTRTVNPHICQHHLERKYTTLTGVLEVLALSIFQQKTVDARGHLVVDGPGRHFFLPMIAGSGRAWTKPSKHLPPTLSVFVARHGPEVGGALAFSPFSLFHSPIRSPNPTTSTSMFAA